MDIVHRLCIQINLINTTQSLADRSFLHNLTLYRSPKLTFVSVKLTKLDDGKTPQDK